MLPTQTLRHCIGNTRPLVFIPDQRFAGASEGKAVINAKFRSAAAFDERTAGANFRACMDQPNILLIMSDQHAACWSGNGGNPAVRAPALDRLASEGVAFDNAYANCPICVPSRMSFLTGRFVSDIEIWDNHTILPSETPTFAHALRKSGYDVVLNGKMHFRGPDRLHGFRAQLSDDPAGRSASSFPIPRWKEGGRVPGAPSVYRPKVKEGAGYKVDYEAEEAAIRYLEDPDRRQNPWAMVVGLYAPHPPWTVEREYLEQYPKAALPMPVLPEGHLENQHPVHRRKRELIGLSEGPLPDEVVREARAAYFALVTRVDAQVSRILEALERQGLREDTVVIYTSDHGEMLGEHGMWNKSSLYDQAARIPLVMASPKRFPSGRRVRENVSLVDLTATILDLAGARDHLRGQGDSLVNLARGADPLWKDEAFSELYATWTDRPLAMLRQGRFKLHASFEESDQLYDMENDPGEFEDLAGRAEYGPLLEHLKSRLSRRWDPAELNRRVLASQDERVRLEEAPRQ